MKRIVMIGAVAGFAIMPSLVAQTRSFEKFTVEGQPIDKRAPELDTDHPVSPRICHRFISADRRASSFRLELGKDDKVINEEPPLTDLNQRIRDVRVFQDGAVYVQTDGSGGRLLKLTPNNSQTRQ
jgi:hypothetical protein